MKRKKQLSSLSRPWKKWKCLPLRLCLNFFKMPETKKEFPTEFVPILPSHIGKMFSNQLFRKQSLHPVLTLDTFRVPGKLFHVALQHPCNRQYCLSCHRSKKAIRWTDPCYAAVCGSRTEASP